MLLLLLGLVIFLGTHSIRIVADDWRSRQIARLGPMPWRGLYSLVSALGLGLIIVGFGQARQNPITLYEAPFWLKHVTILLTIPAFLLLAAADTPPNSLKAAVGHPMILGVKLWAAAHLLCNGGAHDLLLFGGFLIWAIVDFASARRRDRRAGVTPAAATRRGNLAVLGGGLALWALFAFLLHGWLIGVRPFG